MYRPTHSPHAGISAVTLVIVAALVLLVSPWFSPLVLGWGAWQTVTRSSDEGMKTL